MKILGVIVSVGFDAESFHVLPILSISVAQENPGVAFGWLFWTGWACFAEEEK